MTGLNQNIPADDLPLQGKAVADAVAGVVRVHRTAGLPHPAPTHRRSQRCGAGLRLKQVVCELQSPLAT